MTLVTSATAGRGAASLLSRERLPGYFASLILSVITDGISTFLTLARLQFNSQKVFPEIACA